VAVSRAELTEAMRVCALARERSVTVVPHAWKTGISSAAAAHMAAAAPHCAFIEFLPEDFCESARPCRQASLP
jgi:L-alanine-DL-glutamate epimerase-like enolase superfamily enzyme